MNRTFVLLLVAGLTLCGPVAAGLSLHVTSDHESKVYLGNTYLGDTPIDLNSVKLGTHTVKVKSLETGQTQTFSVVSSRVANTEKSIHARFDGASGRQSASVERDDRCIESGRSSRFRVEPYDPPRREYSYREYGYSPYRSYSEYAPAPTYYRPAPAYSTPYPSYYPAPAYSPQYYPSGYSTPYYPGGYSGDPYARRGSSTDRFRNVVLGAAIANEVFNNGRRSRTGIRRGLVGAGLLNELVGGSSRGGYGYGGFGGSGGYGGSAFGSLFGF
ncbi:MAG: PEGA domain-containing protein [Candidatus Wallbacteria bacterium]|nr:PEGA domain-containing protein [Candidatus Wallbacteria bacterium]